MNFFLKAYKFTDWQINLILFLLAAVIVYFFHFFVTNQALEIGFSADDWDLFMRYKALGPNPLAKFAYVWETRGLYTTPYIYYLGLLDILSGSNIHLFQTINVIFKIAATLALFPLILLVFKNRALAFLTTLMYSISYSSVGSLGYPVKGSDYVSIFWMNIFLILYYFLINKNLNFIWYLLGLLLLMVAVAFSPIRMFPIFGILIAIEGYLLMGSPTWGQLKKSFFRILFFYSPFILLILSVPSILIGGPPLGVYQRVVSGDWYILLSPLSGLGYTFVPQLQWKYLFGFIETDNLAEYVGFLISGTFMSFGFFTFLFSFLLLRSRKKFFLYVFTLNFLLDIAIFFVAFNYRYLPIKNSANFYPPTLYPVLIGVFITSLSLVYFFYWIKNRDKQNALLPLLSGFLFLFIFTFGTWVFAPSGTEFSGTSYYLIVATIGTSLFLSVFLLNLLQKALHLKNYIKKILSLIFLFIFLTLIIWISSSESINHLKHLTENGKGYKDQVLMQEKVKKVIGELESENPILVYFDASEIGTDSTFYQETLLLPLPSWMHYQGGKVVNGCFESFFLNKKELAKLLTLKAGERVFAYRGFCIDVGGKGVYYKDILYKKENFYAFKLKNRQLIDITEKTLKELGF